MRVAGITIAMLIAGVVRGESDIPTPECKVAVCMERADIRTAPNVLPFAQTLASRMYASIGVAIDWRSDLRGCPAEGILITLSSHTPENVTTSALAYAKPYEGKYILVLYDRIACERQIPFVLGHILTHEISHMLQGFAAIQLPAV